MTTLQEFYDILENHDWYFRYSEDPFVYRKGLQSIENISKIVTESEWHRKLYDDYRAHVFSGEAFGTEQKEKPVRPGENDEY